MGLKGMHDPTIYTQLSCTTCGPNWGGQGEGAWNGEGGVQWPQGGAFGVRLVSLHSSSTQ